MSSTIFVTWLSAATTNHSLGPPSGTHVFYLHLRLCFITYFPCLLWLDVMLKNCTGCHNRHVAPHGLRCRFKGDLTALNMSQVPKRAIGQTKEERDYITYLEDLVLSKEDELVSQQSKESSAVSEILSRLERLEKSTTNPFVPVFSATNPWMVAPSTAPSVASPMGLMNTAPQGLTSHRPLFTTMPANLPTRDGLSTASTSGAPGQVPSTPLSPTMSTSAPADILTAPLTTALNQLSLAIEPSVSTSTKGITLRPEYYVQHVDLGTPIKSVDHTKLSYRELVSGMGRVLSHLCSVGGDAAGYLEHFNFLTSQAAKHSFVDSAFVGYDRFIVDKVIRGGSKTFIAGDTVGVSTHFHAGNFVYDRKPAGKGRGRGRRSNFGDQDRDTRVPDGFPDDICYGFNYRSCSGKCSKQHICRLCKKDHKASACPDKSDKKK